MGEVFNHWRRGLAVVLCIMCGAGSPRLQGQARFEVATLSGIVSDPNGSTVPNAAVVVRTDPNEFVKAATTDQAGRFSIADLAPGVYVVEVSAPGFSLVRREGVRLAAGRLDEIAITLSIAPVTEQVDVTAALPAAAVNAPSQGSLTASEARSVISGEFIRNFTSPVSDFAEVVQMAPGTFSLNPNGVGLGQGKTYFRGFADGSYTMTFDGIPFQDTNSPTHHSWSFFPAQMIGETDFSRSPGNAATIGPSNFGGSINLLSRSLQAGQEFDATASFGSFNTRLFDAEYSTGRFGSDGSQDFMIQVQDMRSDGYETYNYQTRDAISGKYQKQLSPQTIFTAFASFEDLRSNTPNTGPTRAQLAQFGNNFLMNNDPTSPLCYCYETYSVPTDFEYAGLQSNLGHGWMVDDKVYMYAYHNHQFYDNETSLTPTSAVDKLNAYRTTGNLLPLTQVSDLGIFRTGLWSEYSWTNRYQVPTDPVTHADAILPNFHEWYTTLILEPYVQYELTLTKALKITPGIKLDYYNQNFTHYQDNGKTVGSLNGLPSLGSQGAYHSWLPSLDAHYLLRQNWSAYAQYAQGDTIPPTNVFDVKNAAVRALPQPTIATTYQIGTVYKASRFTLDLDTYYINFQNSYSTSIDPATGEPIYFQSGNSVTRGAEAESNIVLGRGLRLYVNGTAGTARYSGSNLWVAYAPQDTETIGVNYGQGRWNAAFFDKRIGKMWNDNGSIHQAVPIDPFEITDLYVNYTLRNGSRFRQTRIQLAVNNVLNSFNIVGVTPASTKTSLAAPGDVLTLMPGRSVSLTVTFGITPQRAP